MLKKVLSVFVLSIFLAHFAGFYVYFFFQLSQIRMEMRAILRTLPAEKLELITLTPEQFEKSKVEEHEIKVNGKMYDIARIEKRDNLLLIYCMHDEAEDNILAFLDKILSSPLKDKRVPAQIVKFTTLSFILPPTLTLSESSCWLSRNITHYQQYSSSFFPSLDSPPPQLIV